VSIHVIPVNRLSPEALQGVIEEFISRHGTDYGESEASPETSFRQVKHQAGKRIGSSHFLTMKAETTNIFLANDPILKKLDVSAE